MSFIEEHYINLINKAIKKTIDCSGVLNTKLLDAMEYSLFTGGKRLRPLLCIKSYELFDNSIDNIMPFAVSIELIHTYSLIHDDLPSMDNDNIRRGKPTNHKVFGEGFAILSGDALLNLAFENMLEVTSDICGSFEEYKRYVKAMLEIGKYAGCAGMIGGQAIDISNDFDKEDDKKLISMYKAKTASLIEASIVSGAIIGKADLSYIEALRDFGQSLGLAYQIRDDILDYKEDEDINKFTYLDYHNIDRAKKEIDRLSSQAIKSLGLLGDKDTRYFIDLTKKLSTRDI